MDAMIARKSFNPRGGVLPKIGFIYREFRRNKSAVEIDRTFMLSLIRFHR